MFCAAFARSAGGAGAVAPGGGGGPTDTPFFATAGTGSNALGDPTPDYPANTAGDLFVLQAYVQSGDTISTPSGWTAVPSTPVTNGGSNAQYLFTRDARATGSDSGTVTVVTSGSNFCQARIYAFTDVEVSAFIEDVTSTTATDGTCPGPSVTAGGNARLGALFVTSNNGNAGMAACTGESGGDWTEAVAEHTSGIGPGIQMQTADLSSGGTISGGSASVNGTNSIGIGFALVGV